MNITPLLLSGGAGKRLWPISTPVRPKPFAPLLRGGHTLFSHTLARLSAPCFRAPWVVTGHAHHSLVQGECAAAGVRPALQLIEPMGRNTAPAIALSALAAQDRMGDDAWLLVMPTDHFIDQPEALARAATMLADKIGDDDAIGLFGIRPNCPETGYGYVETHANGQVLNFTEKPDVQTARIFCHSGRHYWNSGMFLFRAGAMCRLLAEYAPKLLAQAKQTLSAASEEAGMLRLPASLMREMTTISIDYALMQQPIARHLVPLESHWSDLGSWLALAAYYAASDPLTTRRPWGHYQRLHEAKGFCIKRLTLRPGARLSLQRHAYRAEQWTLLSGQATVECDGAITHLGAGESAFIPQGALHRLANAGKGALEVLEVQVGAHLSEDDIERVEDDYGRILAQTAAA